MNNLKELLKQSFGNKVLYESTRVENRFYCVNAKLKAKQHHAGQTRKYTGEPYVTHCEEVVNLLRYVDGGTADAIQAAWLHDTIEDTRYTLDQLQCEFGDTVAKYVWYLTNVPKFVGDRKKRMAIDNDRLRHAPRLVKEIKCADIISNCLNIAELDPVFAKPYLREKAALLLQFKGCEWDSERELGFVANRVSLLPLARKVVDDALDRLKVGG